ncbi:MAG: PEP-CTERM sorting domain-containing protein [Tepidisphaeraceae bacterium]
MKIGSMKVALVAAAMLGSVAVAPTYAVVIGYSLGGDLSETVELTNGLDATVTLAADTFSVDLTPGVAQEVFFLGGSVSLDATSNASGSGTLSPTLSITSHSPSPSSQVLSQSVSITQTLGSPPFVPASADLLIGAGNTVLFDLGGQYTLSVTPLSESRVGQENLTFPFSNSAEFLLTVVPEPTSGFAMLAGGALLLARRRRRRA